jgi:hypothetical protein
MSLHTALNNSNDPIHVNCRWCDWQLDLNDTDWCTNCDTSIFDDKINNELSKLLIKNIHNTEGLNIEGISIDEWIVEDDNYQFLAYADGHKWMYKLWRHGIEVEGKERYRLELHATGGRCYTKYLGTNEIKIKRLFYKSIKGLLDEHIEWVTKQIVQQASTSLSQSLNIN